MRFSTESVTFKFIPGGKGTNLVIGKFCSVASNLTIFLGGNHGTDWVTTYPFGYIYNQEFGGERSPETIYSNGDVLIGNDVWIGQNVIIMSGVTIGNGACVAAGSVITRSVKDFEIVGGNPARVIRSRFGEDVVSILGNLKWWDLPIETVRTILPILQDSPSIPKLEEILRNFRP